MIYVGIKFTACVVIGKSHIVAYTLCKVYTIGLQVDHSRIFQLTENVKEENQAGFVLSFNSRAPADRSMNFLALEESNKFKPLAWTPSANIFDWDILSFFVDCECQN